MGIGVEIQSAVPTPTSSLRAEIPVEPAVRDLAPQPGADLLEDEAQLEETEEDATRALDGSRFTVCSWMKTMRPTRKRTFWW